MALELYWVLYDPIKERYYSDGGIGRIFVRAAKPFMRLESAANCRRRWHNGRAEIHEVELRSKKCLLESQRLHEEEE